MRFDITNHYIGSPALAAVSFVEHSIGLARSCRRGQVDAQATSPMSIATILRDRLLSLRRSSRGNNAQIAIAQAIAAQQFFRVWTALLALRCARVKWLLAHLAHRLATSAHPAPCSIQGR